MAARDDNLYDLSSPSEKMDLWQIIASLEGLHYVEIKKKRRSKTEQQLRYLHAVVYRDVAAGLAEAWGEKKSKTWVHLAMKEMFLRDEIVDHDTGECRLGAVRSLADLNVSEMCEYIDAVIGWAWHTLNVKVEDANKDWWRKEAA